MSEKPENMFDTLRSAGRILRETAQTLEGVRDAMLSVVRQQAESTQRLRRVHGLVETANRACARADAHLVRTRELLGMQPVTSVSAEQLQAGDDTPQDDYLIRRTTEATEAARRVSAVISDAALHIADGTWLNKALVRIHAEHRIVRDWLDEAVYDVPSQQDAATALKASLDRLESAFHDTRGHAKSLSPFKESFDEVTRLMDDIMEQSRPGNSGE